MSHSSYLKQSQLVRLTQKLILFLLVTRGRVYFNKDSTIKSPYRHKFWTCDLLTQVFFDLQLHLPYSIWPFSSPHTVRPHSSGQYSRVPLCSSLQQAVWNTVQTFLEPVCLERVLQPICLAYMLPQRRPAMFLSAAPGVPIQVLLIDFQARHNNGIGNLFDWASSN